MKKLCILLALLLPAFVLCACVDKPQTQQLSALSVPDLQPDQAAVIVKEGETFLVCTVTLGRDTDANICFRWEAPLPTKAKISL